MHHRHARDPRVEASVACTLMEPDTPLPAEPDDTSDIEFDDEPVADEPVADDPVAVARARHGALGAVVAAGMLGLDQVLGRKPKQEAPIVVAAPSQPHDVDRDGFELAVDDEVSVVAPPLPRTPPVGTAPRRNSGRRRRR